MLCWKNIPHTSTDLLRNKKKLNFAFFVFCAAGTCRFASLLSQHQADTVDSPVWAEGQSINMSCVLHYFQMSEAVSPIVRAFSPAFCHLSPILGPQGHVKIESDSQTSMLNRLIGQSCHGPDQSSLTPVPVRGSLCLNIQPDCVHFKKKKKEKGGNKIQTGRKCEFSPTSSQKWSLFSLTNINVRDPSSDQHVQLTRKKVLLKKIWRKSKNKEQEFSEGCFPPRINEAAGFISPCVWMKMFVSPVLRLI